MSHPPLLLLPAVPISALAAQAAPKEAYDRLAARPKDAANAAERIKAAGREN